MINDLAGLLIFKVETGESVMDIKLSIWVVIVSSVYFCQHSKTQSLLRKVLIQGPIKLWDIPNKLFLGYNRIRAGQGLFDPNLGTLSRDVPRSQDVAA
jgi:hypothetical protein